MPGDPGEKGEAGIGITGPPVSHFRGRECLVFFSLTKIYKKRVMKIKCGY